MNYAQAKRRAARIASDLIDCDEENDDMFYLDDGGKPLPPADIERMRKAVKALARSLYNRGRECP